MNQNPPAPRDPAPDPGVVRARTIARWLDDRYLDPIIGFLLPGFGDAIGLFFGLYIVALAVNRGLPAVIIARMVMNLALDALVGAVPFLGDLFDAFFKSHRKNLALLEARHEDRKASLGDWAVVLAALFAAGVAVFVPAYLLYQIVAWIA